MPCPFAPVETGPSPCRSRTQSQTDPRRSDGRWFQSPTGTGSPEPVCAWRISSVASLMALVHVGELELGLVLVVALAWAVLAQGLHQGGEVSLFAFAHGERSCPQLLRRPERLQGPVLQSCLPLEKRGLSLARNL